MNDKKKLKVKIFDREYSLLVENQEIAAELAEYVNNIMDLEKLIAQDEYMQKETNRQITLLKELEKFNLIDQEAIEAMTSLNNSFGDLVNYEILF